MAVDLARLQFAVTTSLHFLFVILTLGLGPLIAIMETRYVLTRKAVYERMTRFWGQIYIINYALGIIVGLALEFQFGLNWSGLTHYAGDVFGAPLAMETLVAFFVESTLLGIWIFSWGRLPWAIHVALFWLVVVAAYASVLWIVAANGFLQHPVGHVREGDHVALVDLGAVLTNDAALQAVYHIIPVVLATGGFFVAGVSAWHFRRKTPHQELFRRSLRLGLVVAAVAGFAITATGYAQLDLVERIQPIKFASVWEREELPRLQAEAVARYGPGDYTPPNWIAGAFKLMSWIGSLFEYLFWLPLVFLIRNLAERRTGVQRLLIWFIPVPFVASIAGWLVREVGRQPWLVYGELRTEQAASPVGTGAVLVSLVLFAAVFAVLAVVDYLLIARVARDGPDHVVLGSSLAVAEPEREPAAGGPTLRL